MVSCSNPGDCAEIERRARAASGLLVDGGTSRGNLLSGRGGRLDPHGQPASPTRSRRIPATARSSPTASNVTRTLVLFFWEVMLELVAAARQRRRDVRPRGHRGGSYPLLRAAMCVFVRDLVVFSVLQDMFRGVPAVYATFASYDEVAHHSGLERADTLEALRKLDQRFGLIDGRAATRRGRTRSSSCPTTGRPRAPPSSSATATGSTDLVRALAVAGAV